VEGKIMNTPISVEVLVDQYLQTLQFTPDNISDKEKYQELDRLRHEILCQGGIEKLDKAIAAYKKNIPIRERTNPNPESEFNKPLDKIQSFAGVGLQFGKTFWISGVISSLMGLIPLISVIGEVGKINKVTDCQINSIHISNEEKLLPIQNRIKELGGIPPNHSFTRISAFECKYL
jgi:hypothetical protein